MLPRTVRRAAPSRPSEGDCAREFPRVSVAGAGTIRSGQGVTAVRAVLRGSVPRPAAAHPAVRPQSAFPPASVRVLAPSGPLVRLYGRQHIDLQRVAGALCCR
ncbi:MULTISPECIES: putative leader peptide [unclassified Streptomyces]|uniref:putative leader peptide n=1 Tax=unclassified Streptomyces TaxID=2593676 RepID=UPI0038677754